MGPTAGGGQKPNVLAIVSLVTGILGALTCGGCGILAVAAIVTGLLGRNQIKASNGLETGDGLALGGLIAGAIGIVEVIGWILLVAVGN